MAEKINRMYKPSEMEEVQKQLESIYDEWFNSVEKPEQTFVNFTITRLYKNNYRIIKIRPFKSK